MKKMKNNDLATPWPSHNVTPEFLLQAARNAQLRSYSPYSHFPVGAALLSVDDEVVIGCNVENASLGLTVCAERNTIGNMVVSGLKDPLVIAIVGKEGEPCYPCGACRQVLWEFNPDLLVLVEDGEKGWEILPLRMLLPHAFSRKGFKDK
ncbi:MAG TPA: cytidine deaminase [Aminobacterium sp.]|jgi:cytidine deaminase|uniref:cytidine deaminase n=2 Tax=Aminobacteriaceae TaxID=3029087 RepID=UPI000EC720A5|nr:MULTISPECIES: cytidine deaminase [unclassified Aminobacterium]HCA40615.1 cytidine deaminase [Aminobacterium sp.]